MADFCSAVDIIATTDTRQPDSRLSVSSRSWVERPQRLSSVTRIASIWRACASFITSARAERFAFMPDAVSRKTSTTS